MSQADSHEARWDEHAAAWRDPAAVVAGTDRLSDVEPALLRGQARGHFWEVLEARQLTLLITREYEHLLVGLTSSAGRPLTTYCRLPHPSGMAFDAKHRLLHVAATRNPNQVVTFTPLAGLTQRSDVPSGRPVGKPLVPVRSRFLPGCLYLHDLALIGGELFGNAVGENAVVHFTPAGKTERVWWPRAIEREGHPDFTRNYLQLNSIAAGPNVHASFFSASTHRMSTRRPGHLNFPVDRRGVIFAGSSREPIASGLTRPHSARLHDGTLWVANSGYGELGTCEDGIFRPVCRFQGWTRGLALIDDIAFIGTSRVIPKFHRYAPGLDVGRSVCGVHAVDLASGRVIGSLTWPMGNQIFGIVPVPAALTTGFMHSASRNPSSSSISRVYYSFRV